MTNLERYFAARDWIDSNEAAGALTKGAARARREHLTYWKNSIGCEYLAGELFAAKNLAEMGVPGFYRGNGILTTLA